jgi:membrane protease YdiL (CAAX protease family)
VGINQGSEGVRNLFAGWLKWRVNAGWYLFGLAPLAIALAVAGLYAFRTGTAPGIGTGIAGSTLLSMLVFHSIQGATGEELGWRGLALPGLQKRYSALLSAVILGLVISGWHSILHLVSPVGVPEWQFWLIMVCYSVLVTWAYNNTGGSLLIVSLFHFAFNFSLELVTTQLGLIPLRALFWIYCGVYLLLAVGVVALAGPRRLSRRSDPAVVVGQVPLSQG